MRLARVLTLVAPLLGPALGLMAATATSAAADLPTAGAPWHAAPIPAWRPCDPAPEIPPLKPAQSRESPLRVNVNSSGVLRVVDGLGRVRLRTGLPGRPLRLWRDAGTALQAAEAPFAFPAQTPLSTSQSLGPDFRPNLEGLLWILDDSGRYLTLVHPATNRVAYLPLPDPSREGRIEPRWFPDHLEIRILPSDDAAPRTAGCWSIPWMGLVPQILQLATPAPEPPPGTALLPFPKE